MLLLHRREIEPQKRNVGAIWAYDRAMSEEWWAEFQDWMLRLYEELDEDQRSRLRQIFDSNCAGVIAASADEVDECLRRLEDA
jgi:hypothetical protein